MSRPELPRFKVMQMVLLPQLIMFLISATWIFFFPKDNVIQYFNFSLPILFQGLLTGLGLALAGYGFYRFAKKTKKFYAAVELFEYVLSPTFKNLIFIDIVILSLVAGFNEEIFFRGLLFPKVGLILSSLAFGVLHFPGKKYWIYAVWATGSAALFAYLFFLSNSLLVPIIGHAVNNLIGMILLTRMANNKRI